MIRFRDHRAFAVTAIRALAFSVPIGMNFAVPHALSAQSSAKRALGIEDFYRLKTVGAAEISPDGRWVAFTVSTRVEESNGTTSEVWLASTSGTGTARAVSAPGSNASTPSWNNDGTLRFSAGARTLRLLPAQPDRVDTVAGAAPNRAGNARAMTSPDGQWIATVRDTPPPRREPVYASDFEKRHEERFKGVQFDWLDFHRDGAAFPTPNVRDPNVSPPQEVFLAAASGGEARALTSLGLRPVGVQWRHDGSALLFSADSTYRNERIYGRTDAWTVTAGGQLRRLTTNNDYDYNGAQYSPDGRWVLCTRQLTTDVVIARKLDHGGATDLVLIPADGGAERVLTADWDYLPANAVWSPDSKSIYFTGGVGGTQHLFRVSPDGGAVKAVTTGQRRLSGFSFDRAFTRMTYVVGTFQAPSELWSADMDGTHEVQLTQVHAPFVGELALSTPERLQFTSADGTPLEGWLTFPAGYSAARGPYPLVVSNHGGPHSAIEYNFNFKNQYLAANGYFVLEVNFRSSTNYGEKFLWGTWGAWGTRDGQDVMAGIDHVLGRFAIDRRKVATIGHSYGGFMTNWLITQYPDRFAAAIPGAGIVNWVSDYGNADIPRTKETEFFGTPWDPKAREIMIRQSPLTYADRAKAPTLFINGEIDQRVPYSEAQQMYVALKKNGVPTRMIQYADQPHAIGGSWNQVHRILNESHWLDQWLKPALRPPTP
jgi:dipeptidyl aminopeptidase/acylaminoacyl peptidase